MSKKCNCGGDCCKSKKKINEVQTRPEIGSDGKPTGVLRHKLTGSDTHTLTKVADLLKKQKGIKGDQFVEALVEILKERYGVKKLKELTVKVKADDLDRVKDRIKDRLDPDEDEIAVVPEESSEDDWVDQAIRDYEEMQGNKHTRNNDDLEKGIHEKSKK